jgi:hypothetical protein
MAKPIKNDDSPQPHAPLKIIFLCGAPRTGKDTLAKLIFDAIGRCRIYKMTTPIDAMLQGTFELSSEAFQFYREKEKDTPQPLFNGLTPRQVMIRFSEEFMKPNLGSDIFGKLACMRLRSSVGNLQCVVISDSGFYAEILPIIQAYGAANCLQIVLHRKGCTFEGDSRSVWHDRRVCSIDIYNDHSMNRLQSVALFELVSRCGLALKPGFQYKLD